MTIARIKVLLTAAPTYIMIIVAGIGVAVQELLPMFHGPWVEVAGAWAAKVSVVLIGTVSMIRRHTPAPKDQRGMLAQPAYELAPSGFMPPAPGAPPPSPTLG